MAEPVTLEEIVLEKMCLYSDRKPAVIRDLKELATRIEIFDRITKKGYIVKDKYGGIRNSKIPNFIRECVLAYYFVNYGDDWVGLHLILDGEIRCVI